MFVHIAKKSTFTSALEAKYVNSIVFIQDTQEIWTHGTFYAIPDSYKNQINSVETAVAALQKVYSFGSITDGTNTASATESARSIKFTGKNAANVTVSASGVEIDVHQDTLVTGTANGTVKFNGTDVAVQGLGSAAYQASTAFGSASDMAQAKSDISGLQTQVGTNGQLIANAQQAADAAMAEAQKRISAVTGENAVKVTGDGTAKQVSLALDNSGNVQFSQGTNGLKATVEIPAPTVTGVKSGDNVIKLEGTELVSNIAFSVDSSADAQGKKYLRLTGLNGADLGKVDIAEFVKDGMLNAASFNPSDNKLTLTFNTDSGKDAIEVDLSELVDVYNGGNVKLTAVSLPDAYSLPAVNDSVDVAISKLAKGVAVANANAGVVSFGGKVGEITVKGNNEAEGSINLKMANNELQAEIVGLKSAAFTESSAYATAAQGAKADSAVQSVGAEIATNSTAMINGYITTNLSDAQNPSIVLNIGTMAVGTHGVATVADTKAYVDNLWRWEEL